MISVVINDLAVLVDFYPMTVGGADMSPGLCLTQTMCVSLSILCLAQIEV